MQKLRYRQIHLDFHTSPEIEGVGAAFDAEHWKATLQAGHVDSVTLFATCHHGWAYYDTEVGERHPHLNFDLLRKQVDACHEVGIKTPIYLTAGVNNWASANHPGWREVDADGRYAGWTRSPVEPGFHSMCFNTPYLDLLCRQIVEVGERFPEAYGIFLDIINQRPCCCPWCLDSMAEAGLDATVEADRQKQADASLLKYYEKTTAAAKSVRGDMPVFHNSGHIAKGRTDLLRFFSHLELESLPTGGWGYDHFPLSARYVSQLPLDALGMTGKFHTTWGEFGGFKHPDALEYECAAMLAHGTKCSVGDQLHPSGQLDESTYRLIGQAYAEVEAAEPYCDGAVAVAEIGLLSSASCFPERGRESDADTGAGRVLLESHLQFSILDAAMDFEPYRLLILPDDIPVGGELKQKLDRYLADGGKLLLTGRSGLNDDATASVFDLGAELGGMSPYEPDFALPAGELRPDFCDSPFVMYRRAVRMKAAAGRSLGDVFDPYFNRRFDHFCSHQHTPPRPDPSGFDLGVEHGPIVHLAHPVFTIYAGYGAVIYRQFIVAVIDRLLGGPRTVRTGLPSQGRVVLNHQPDQNRYVLHLLYANPTQRGGTLTLSGGTTRATQPIQVIDGLTPLHQVEVILRNLPTIRAARAVRLGEDLALEPSADGLRFVLPELVGHEMVTLTV